MGFGQCADLGPGIPAAEDLVATLQAVNPDTAESTIYRALADFEQLGILVHVHIGHGPAIYHLAADAHAHLVCDRCSASMHLLSTGQNTDPFPPERRFDDTTDRRDAHRAIGFSAVGLALTGLVELAVAILTGSVGLLGDAIHNLSDVSTSAVVSIGFRVSKRTATPTFPYGYERAEDIAGLGIAAVIWASAVFAGAVSIHKLTVHGRTSHLGVGMIAAAVGIVGNQVVARYKLRVGRRIQSATLVADAQHSWLDALSSAGALLGLIAVAGGFRWADGVAGLVVTGFILHVGWEVTGELVRHLMDGVDPDILSAAENAALGLHGLSHVHVRGRWMGRSLIVEVEGFVPADTTIGEAEAMREDIIEAVLDAAPEARAVLWYARATPPRESSPGE